MPNPSELARQDEEKRPLPKAEKFDITIDFGPHQAKLSIDADTLGGLNTSEGGKIARAVGEEIEPHIIAMLAAEERNHG
jgi:hypothetical protein